MDKRSVEKVAFEGEYIQLNQLLKKVEAASSGGEAKWLIEEGKVKVNGAVETAVRKKLHDGDTIEVDGQSYQAVKEE